MNSKVTDTKSFVKKAKSIWGDQYDYSQVVYVRSSTKVLIKCKKHNKTWECTPNNHTRKTKPKGCRLCGEERLSAKFTKPFDKFVTDARKVHGHKYQYDSESYLNARTKTKIFCPFHKIFEQTPEAHFNQKQGCPKCAQERLTREQLLSIDEINRRLAEKSGSLVTIDPKTFKSVNRQAEFNCLKHKRFKKKVRSAIYGVNPCPKCGKEKGQNKGHTTESFTNLIIQKVGSKYKIQDFEYKNKDTIITLECIDHGSFSFRAGSIYRISGCPRCSRISSQQKRTEGMIRKNKATLKIRRDDWIEKARGIHGDYFDYSLAEYTTARSKVTIICPSHGEFEQAPYAHLKSGCKKCASEDLQGRYTYKYFDDFPERRTRPARLYYLEFIHHEGIFYKIGVTVTTIIERFAMIRPTDVEYEILGEHKTTLYDAFLKEQEIQKTHGDRYRYTPVIEGFDNRKIRIGPTECFSKKLSQRTFAKYFE